MAKRKTFNLDKLRGIDLREIGDKGSLSYMSNLLTSDGVNKKRKGWRVLYDFKSPTFEEQRINGIHHFVGEDSHIVVHAGAELFKCDYGLKEIEKIPLDEGVQIGTRQSLGVMFGGVLWLSGMGALLCYDGKTVKKAHGARLAYVPTTTVGIGDAEKGVSPQENEGESLLTAVRKNTLRGLKNDTGSHKFFLDAPARYGYPFKLSASFRVKTSAQGENDYTTRYIGTLNGAEISTVVTVKMETDSLTNEEWTAEAVALDEWGREITVNGLHLSCKVSNGRELTLGFDALAYEADKDNITVEFYEDKSLSYELDGVGAMCESVLKNGESQLILACGGMLYRLRTVDGQIYASSRDAIFVGQENEEITAVSPMSDGYVAVYKKNRFFRLRLEEGDVSGWRIFSSSEGVGCVSPRAVSRLSYDTLAFGGNGIFGIGDNKNAEYMTTKLYNRSARINKAFLGYGREDKAAANCVTHGEHFYLFIGDQAFVTLCDCKDKSGADFGYEWWMLDGCPCTYAASINGTLYMGRGNGEVAIFDEGYTDRTVKTLEAQSLDFVIENRDYSFLSVNYASRVNEGDRISLDSHYVFKSRCDYDAGTGKISIPTGHFYDELGKPSIFEGEEVLIKSSKGDMLYEGIIIKTDPAECQIYCGGLGGADDTGLYLYIKRGKEAEYELVFENGGFYMFSHGSPITLESPNVERVYVKAEKEIECALYTPALDLGDGKAKTLYAIGFTPSPDTEATVEVGYETKRNTFSRSVNIASCLDMDRVGYDRFTFSPRFKESITVNCLERGFDYIRLKLSSVGGRELGICSLSIIYE